MGGVKVGIYRERIPECLARRGVVALDHLDRPEAQLEGRRRYLSNLNPDRTLDYTRLLMDMDRDDEAIQVVQTRM